MADFLVQHSVLFGADGIEIPFSLKGFVKLWDGKGGTPSKEAHDVALCVARHDGYQKSPPVIGAVDVALAQRTAFQVAELIEDEQRVIVVVFEGRPTGRVRRWLIFSSSTAFFLRRMA